MVEDPRVDEWLDLWEASSKGQAVSLDEFVRQHCGNASAAAVEQFKSQVRALASMDRRLEAAGLGDSPTGGSGDTNPPTNRRQKLEPGFEPVPGYRLVSRLGRGGFGEVWRATGPGNFPIALKFVRWTSREERALALLREIRHPNIVSISGTWNVGKTIIIAMELADRTLLDRLREAQSQGMPGIPCEELLDYMAESAKAIDYLNGYRSPGKDGPKGVQHQDLKPANILLVGGSVKVADFSLIQAIDHSTTTHDGGGTPHYSAPEYLTGRTSKHSDQYSLAVTYCELRGGRRPFEGKPAQVMTGHLSLKPDLSMLPEEERAAVRKALSKKPRNRWPSCRAFVEGLRQPASRERAAGVTPLGIAAAVAVVAAFGLIAFLMLQIVLSSRSRLPTAESPVTSIEPKHEVAKVALPVAPVAPGPAVPGEVLKGYSPSLPRDRLLKAEANTKSDEASKPPVVTKANEPTRAIPTGPVIAAQVPSPKPLAAVAVPAKREAPPTADHSKSETVASLSPAKTSSGVAIDVQKEEKVTGGKLQGLILDVPPELFEVSTTGKTVASPGPKEGIARLRIPVRLAISTKAYTEWVKSIDAAAKDVSLSRFQSRFQLKAQATITANNPLVEYGWPVLALEVTAPPDTKDLPIYPPANRIVPDRWVAAMNPSLSHNSLGKFRSEAEQLAGVKQTRDASEVFDGKIDQVRQLEIKQGRRLDALIIVKSLTGAGSGEVVIHAIPREALSRIPEHTESKLNVDVELLNEEGEVLETDRIGIQSQRDEHSFGFVRGVLRYGMTPEKWPVAIGVWPGLRKSTRYRSREETLVDARELAIVMSWYGHLFVDVSANVADRVRKINFKVDWEAIVRK